MKRKFTNINTSIISYIHKTGCIINFIGSNLLLHFYKTVNEKYELI